MKKVILVAFAMDPRYGTEDGRAAKWLDILSKHYYVEVFTDAINREGINSRNYINTTFHFIQGTGPSRTLSKITGLANIATNIFFRKVKKELEKFNVQEYELIHCITPAGIHSHNDLYKLGIPLIAGPLGGGLPTPRGFEQAFRSQRTKTFLRDFFYWWHIKHSPGLRKYLLNAHRVVLGMSLSQDILPEEVKKKCVFIPDALVDTNYFTPPAQHSENEIVRVLFAGRFISNKGLLLLLDATKVCLERGVSNFVIEFAGFGLLEDYFKKQILKNDFQQHMKLIGSLSKEALLNKYQSSDIFCLPTLREPGGIAILEAMACGLPVITSNYGGPAVSVTSDCGVKISMSNYAAYVEELADALCFLINNPAVRRRMGTMGRNRAVNEYSIEALGKKIKCLYEDTVNLNETKASKQLLNKLNTRKE